ncbi:hypothetical protein D0T50_08550 [Bacteroides sp. 214]|uniref:tetratricopeptide repeat protein n=1 Tax=Bacteroides sp. 214 TaxID=2302935 RepID=UPI0013D416D2|nr:hypothetical protein [Bacteroides sp. 214]NDW12940.1 hypothetical protein [Bacteroides sp. 214]
MKKVLFSMVLLMASSFAFAQVKSVKDADKIAKEAKPDFAKAEKLINEALQSPETKDDAETWNVAGLIAKKYYDKETEKAYLNQKYDTVKSYNSIFNMFTYFLKADELAQIPDAKGKIKNKYRKTNAATLKQERPNLLNGGIYFFNENNNTRAFDYFSLYIESSKSPILESENFMQTDTLMGQIAYYATLAAAKEQDDAKMLKYASLAENDAEVGKYAMEFAATAHKNLGDTVQWLTTLQNGIAKYPEHAFFFGHLIDYYSNNNKNEEAMAFADNMIAKDPSNDFYLYVKAYLYQNMADYDNAIVYYKKTIETNSEYAEAYSNIGLAYLQKAQDFSEKATLDIDSPQYAKDQETLRKFYEDAKPYYEKARELKPEERDLWIQGLYRVYYNLNMGAEFEEIEKLMGL